LLVAALVLASFIASAPYLIDEAINHKNPVMECAK